MKLREIIYDIRERLKINTDDMDMTDEYFAHLINVKRALLVKQRYGKFSKNIPEELKQSIHLELEVNSASSGCEMLGLVSIKKIPSYIETYNRDNILEVRLLDLTSNPITIIPIQRLPFIGHNKWLQNEVYATLEDSKIALYSNNAGFKLLEQVKVSAMFTNPEEAHELDSNTDCEFFDIKYPINSPMVSDIINMIVKELAPTLSIPEDKINNADESPR